MKRLLKIIGVLLGLVVLAAALLIGWLSVAEYQPEDVEPVQVTVGARHDSAQTGTHYKLVSMNIGYGGLGRDMDFFMDGGTRVQTDSRDEVDRNLAGIQSALALQDADLYFLQEVDVNSKRSYHIDETALLRHGLSMGAAFACNYKCDYVPFPWPTIGKVESGLLTLGNLAVTEATRESLPCPFGWPVRVANLKRCLLIERVPVADSDKELVLINLHLEAYSDAEGRTKQTEQLFGILKAELNKGNYVIAGGDFNSAFPNTLEQYPIADAGDWQPGVLNEEELPSGFAYAYDASKPTCRSLRTAYTGDRSEIVLYVIDGYIVSQNVQVNRVETVDLNFENADHHPVLLEFTLQ